MRSSIALLAASVFGALAQETSTVSLFLGGTTMNGQAYAGSVVTATPSGDTVYELQCTAVAACGTLSLPQTITIGPTHLNYQYATETMGVDASASETCQISGTASASCLVTIDLKIDIPGVTSTRTSIVATTILTGTELAGVPVELTAGVEKLAAVSGSSTSSGSGGAAASLTAASASAGSASSASGASSIMTNGRAGDILALVMFSAVSVSVGAIMLL